MVEEIFAKTQIVICVGSGGVGKTTVSSALAIRAAAVGKKVLVFTMDPSRRLATCLGLDSWSGKEICVKKYPNGGEMWASMVDHKKIFDEFVADHCESPEDIEKMLKNRLYTELSTSLSGSQDFTSLRALYKAHQSRKYDVIVLDTPPAQHTLDFVKAPEALFNLFKGPVVDWFMKINEKRTGLASVFSKGTRVALSVLEKLTGIEFISELQVFFSTVSTWREAVQKTVIETQNLMMGEKTQFLIVSNLDDSKLQQAAEVISEFKRLGFKIHHVVVNKVLPTWEFNSSLDGTELKLVEFYKNLQRFYKRQLEMLTKNQVRGLQKIVFWTLPQVAHEENDLLSLEKLSNLFQNISKESHQ